jgi:hypothetical protein
VKDLNELIFYHFNLKMLRLFNFSRFNLVHVNQRAITNTRSVGGGTSWADYKKHQARFGKDRADADRLEYEKEIKERTSRKLNWNIKNRWE